MLSIPMHAAAVHSAHESPATCELQYDDDDAQLELEVGVHGLSLLAGAAGVRCVLHLHFLPSSTFEKGCLASFIACSPQSHSCTQPKVCFLEWNNLLSRVEQHVLKSCAITW